MTQPTKYVIYDRAAHRYLTKRYTWTSNKYKAWTAKSPETLRNVIDHKCIMPDWFKDRLIITEQ